MAATSREDAGNATTPFVAGYEEEFTETFSELNRAGFEVPNWLSCAAGNVNPEWKRFAHLVRLSFGSRRYDEQLHKEIREAADTLIEQYWIQAQDWASYVEHKSWETRDEAYVHLDEATLYFSQDFTPPQYMLSGGDSRWTEAPAWIEAERLCPYGYIVALYIRSRTHRLAGLASSASLDLNQAMRMLGILREFDFVDPLIWGIGVYDLEIELMRSTVPPSSQHFLNNTIMFRPRVNETFWNGDALALAGEPWGLRHLWLEPLPDWTEYAWHALHLNTVIRQWTHEAVERAQASEVVPRFTMVAMPPYLALFLIPMLQRIWGVDLPLDLFSLGQWGGHEKCEECMADYGRRYWHESMLQELPMVRASTSSTELPDWKSGFWWQDFQLLLRAFLEDDPAASKADVILCTGPMWLSFSLHLAANVPVASLDLVNFDTGGYGGGPVEDRHGQSRPFLEDLMHGPPLRGLMVREDLFRGYRGFDRGELGITFPYVGALSMFIKERYKCIEGAEALVMRPGSAGKWGKTLRGRLFFSAMRQFETESAPWRFRLLHMEDTRLSFEEIAHHRVAIWVPMVTGKMTFKDLLTAEIPVFSPDQRLQASILSVAKSGALKCLQHGHPWLQVFCREALWGPVLPLLTTFRHPGIAHFSSVTDLVLKLSRLDCPALERISLLMHRFNAMIIADDEKFWREALVALKVWNEEMHSGNQAEQAANSEMAGNQAEQAASSIPYHTWPWNSHALDDHYRKSPWLPKTTVGYPEGWDFPGLHGICGLMNMSSKNTEWICYQHVRELTHGPLGDMPLTWGRQDEASCFSNRSLCSDQLLSYGLHLGQAAEIAAILS